ncbi:MAG: efflux family protein [Planctomycetaceae bacterium]|nr:efflux family protein [Planctomycetaceae bacterium]
MSATPLAVQPAEHSTKGPSLARSIRELLTIALPLAISAGSVTMMHLANRLFLTWYSQDALAAVLPASMWNWTLLSLFIGTAQYVNTFVAQYEGAQRPDRVASAIWQGAYFAIVSGLLLTLLSPFTSVIFHYFSNDPQVRDLEIQYFQIVCLGSLPVVLSSVLGCFFSGRQFTRITMIVNLTGSLINIALDSVLIFGFGPIPRCGMVGAAWATVTAEYSILLIYLVLLWRSQDAARYGLWKNWHFESELFRRLLRFGLPGGFHWLVDVLGFSVFIFLIGEIDKQVAAATTLAFNLNTLAFLPVSGLGTAVSILVGNRIGDGKPDEAARITWLAFGVAAIYMLMFGAIFVGLPDLLLSPYVTETNVEEFERIRPIVVKLLWFVAVYSLFDAMAIVFGAGLRGAGDTRFAMLFSFLSCWLLMVVPTWIGVSYWHWGVMAAWTACTVYVVFMGLGFAARFQQGKWRSMRVIEVPAPDIVESPAREDILPA